MVFSASEIDQFVRDGYVILRDGFSREVASAGRDFIWKELDLSPDRPDTWTEPLVHLQKFFTEAPFDQVLNPRVEAAVAELTGAGRADVHGLFGWWPVLFPGFEGPGGWHVDGSNFHHRLTSREQGLVTLYLFSDIAPGDGGTALAPGSHLEIAKTLSANEPDGLSLEALMERLPEVDLDQVVEVTGRAGDVAFLHPFLVHGFNENSSKRVRFACNPQYALKHEMNLDRSDGSHSPVEEAIRLALGKT